MAHTPVLAAAAVSALEPRAGGTYVDATFGGGGYSVLLLDAAPGCRVVAFDRDPDAAARARGMAADEPRLTVVESGFGRLADGLRGLGLDAVDGIVFDLGVSSFQLDDPARGFSFRLAGPLDMRMERRGPSAADLVNGLDEAELARLLRELGDEPDARRVARAILAERAARGPIATTDALAAVVARAKGGRGGSGRDPATLTFQALRIAVNDELGELERALEGAEAVLRPGGRLVVVAFHSGEDAIVKRFVDGRGGRAPAAANRHLPASAAPAEAARWRWVARKVATPGAEERAGNRRARSAKLRVAERVGEARDEAGEGGAPWPVAA